MVQLLTKVLTGLTKQAEDKETAGGGTETTQT